MLRAAQLYLDIGLLARRCSRNVSGPPLILRASRWLVVAGETRFSARRRILLRTRKSTRSWTCSSSLVRVRLTDSTDQPETGCDGRNRMADIRSQFKKNGYFVMEDFFDPEEIEEMKFCGEDFTKNLPPESERKIFSTVDQQQSKDQYFLDSANNVSLFFEADALEDDGKLKVHPRVALNKIGHGLHWLHPTFRKYTFDERVKETAYQLEYQEPAVCQSMYIYKNPGLGSEVAHQDATYLYTEPMTVLGFWIALEDANQENGCLWIAPGIKSKGHGECPPIRGRFRLVKDHRGASL
ncbi:hypothetical protein KM043_017419 [Ampulex compressa]|nr:hypothetical protein KM043_017419 [Ampulex compressa]